MDPAKVRARMVELAQRHRRFVEGDPTARWDEDDTDELSSCVLAREEWESRGGAVADLSRSVPPRTTATRRHRRPTHPRPRTRRRHAQDERQLELRFPLVASAHYALA